MYVRGAKSSKIFLHSGAKSYIGSIDYVDGNAALMFTIRLFYGVINHGKTLEEAFQEASLIDEETHTFRFYISVKHVYSIFE